MILLSWRAQIADKSSSWTFGTHQHPTGENLKCRKKSLLLGIAIESLFAEDTVQEKKKKKREKQVAFTCKRNEAADPLSLLSVVRMAIGHPLNFLSFCASLVLNYQLGEFQKSICLDFFFFSVLILEKISGKKNLIKIYFKKTYGANSS